MKKVIMVLVALTAVSSGAVLVDKILLGSRTICVYSDGSATTSMNGYCRPTNGKRTTFGGF